MTSSSTSPTINWETDTTSSLVALPTHSLFMRAAGHSRRSNHPAIIIITGLGQESRYWAAVARQISSFARVYSYDRSGYGKSDARPSPRPDSTASLAALELQQLLQTAGVRGPFVVLAHSYGGIVSREFLALEKENIVGMVFVDANSEFSYKVRPKGLQEAFEDIMQHVDFHKLINLEERQKLTAEEWAAVNEPESEEEQTKHGQAFGEEAKFYDQSCDELGEKKQYEVEGTILGDHVVSVVEGNNQGVDIKILYEEALKRGYGSDESRETVGRWLEMDREELKLQKDQLKLSRKGRLVHAEKSGHDVHLTDPEIIVEEVRWILEVLGNGK